MRAEREEGLALRQVEAGVFPQLGIKPEESFQWKKMARCVSLCGCTIRPHKPLARCDRLEFYLRPGLVGVVVDHHAAG